VPTTIVDAQIPKQLDIHYGLARVATAHPTGGSRVLRADGVATLILRRLGYPAAPVYTSPLSLTLASKDLHISSLACCLIMPLGYWDGLLHIELV